MYVEGFDGIDSGDFGPLEEALRSPTVATGIDPASRVKVTANAQPLRRPWAYAKPQAAEPLGPPVTFDEGVPETTDDGNGNGAPVLGDESEKAKPDAWYETPWPWVALAAVLGVAVFYLASRRKRNLSGFGDLREKLHAAKLITPDLKAGLYYVWRGGNAVCVYDNDGAEQVCFSTTEPTIQAARDLMRKKIRAYHEPGRERWSERDPRFA